VTSQPALNKKDELLGYLKAAAGLWARANRG